MKSKKYYYPIAFCPLCRRAVMYSGDPRDKNAVEVKVAGEEYSGRTVFCAKCKTMLALVERRGENGVVFVPMLSRCKNYVKLSDLKN